MKWLMPQISSHMRSPQAGLLGYIAMKLMKRFNTRSIREGINRLQLKNSDTFVEIGAGNGDGLRTLLESNRQLSKMPARVVLIEISHRFRTELNKLIQNSDKDTTSCIEVHPEDCITMPFLEDNSVDKMFGMNVVYFLHPLHDYLDEIKRVLKPGGMIVFGCKFGALPEEGATAEFVNVDRKKISIAMQKEGFVVSMNKVVVDEDNEMTNYIEIIGVKPFDTAE